MCPKPSAVAQVDSSASQDGHDRRPAGPGDGTESKVVSGSEIVRAHEGAIQERWQRFDVAGELRCHIAIGNRLIDFRNHQQSWIPGDANGNDGVVKSNCRAGRLRGTNRDNDSKTNPRGCQAGQKQERT